MELSALMDLIDDSDLKRFRTAFYDYLNVTRHTLEDSNKSKETLLIVAVIKGQPESVLFLIGQGVRLDAKNETNEKTALMFALGLGHQAIAECLLKAGASTDVVDAQGNTPLFYILRDENLQLIKYFIRKKVNIHHKNQVGLTPLMVASKAGQLKVVKLLLENEANVYDKDIEGKTALMHAICYSDKQDNQLKIIDALVQEGGPELINAQDNSGQTALLYAVHLNFVKLSAHFLENGAQPDLLDRLNLDVLSYALYGTQLEIAQQLIEYNASPLSALSSNIPDIEQNITNLFWNAIRFFPTILFRVFEKRSDLIAVFKKHDENIKRHPEVTSTALIVQTPIPQSVATLVSFYLYKQKTLRENFQYSFLKEMPKYNKKIPKQ